MDVLADDYVLYSDAVVLFNMSGSDHFDRRYKASFIVESLHHRSSLASW